MLVFAELGVSVVINGQFDSVGLVVPPEIDAAV